jgi:7,8-dihydropterin-6-yl-methyl-4-(beta-D-ribofuranosyl)aminobenzene 5'-phosphate synthase
MCSSKLNELEMVKIVSLEDNFIERLSGDNSSVITRASVGNNLTYSVLAEHGFSTLVDTTLKNKTKKMIFDFGLSKDIAARNADTMNIDLTQIETAGLSHGHIDHVGGLEEIVKKIGKNGLEIVTHPAAFRLARYRKLPNGNKIKMPPLEKKKLIAAGLKIIETREPYYMLGGDVLFMGEIPRRTSFEVGMPDTFYEENGKETHDIIEDDTALIMNVKGKGLVIITGCAHAGIINTVEYARELTGVKKVHAIFGGFHLCGPDFESIIDITVDKIKEIEPDYILPTHCTGMNAINAFKKEMPKQFIRNMSGTKLTFTA